MFCVGFILKIFEMDSESAKEGISLQKIEKPTLYRRYNQISKFKRKNFKSPTLRKLVNTDKV